MKVALLGYGYWGKILRKYIDNSEHFDLIYIYKPNQDNFDMYTNNLNKILNDPSIKAVFIATPIKTHYDLARIMLFNKKHVFCEKPLTSNIKEAMELKEIAKKNNVVMETNFIYNDSLGIKKLLEFCKFKKNKITYIYASIKQFGNFYEYDNVYEVLGSHVLSVIFNLFEEQKFNVKYDHYIINSKNIAESGRIRLYNNNLKIDILVSLKDIEKERKVVIYTDKDIVQYNALSTDTVKVVQYDKAEGNAIVNKINFSYNESDNLKYSIDRFWNVINKKQNSNIDIAIKVADSLYNYH